MAVNEFDFLGTSPDRLLAGAIVLHEASSHPELLHEMPVLLRATLSASRVTVTFIGMDLKGNEVARAAHHSGAEPAPQEEDWVAALLRERLARRATGSATKTTVRFVDERIQVLCEICGNRAVAYEIAGPITAFDAEGPQGRTWLLAILENMSRNISQRLTRPSPAMVGIPLFGDLTMGEWRILLAMDSNDSEKAIAANLGLSTHTIHSHIKNVYRVLGARSRLEAISILRRAELQALLQSLLNAVHSKDATKVSAPWQPAPAEAGANPFDGWAPILKRQDELAGPGRKPAPGAKPDATGRKP